MYEFFRAKRYSILPYMEMCKFIVYKKDKNLYQHQDVLPLTNETAATISLYIEMYCGSSWVVNQSAVFLVWGWKSLSSVAISRWESSNWTPSLSCQDVLHLMDEKYDLDKRKAVFLSSRDGNLTFKQGWTALDLHWYVMHSMGKKQDLDKQNIGFLLLCDDEILSPETRERERSNKRKISNRLVLSSLEGWNQREDIIELLSRCTEFCVQETYRLSSG